MSNALEAASRKSGEAGCAGDTLVPDVSLSVLNRDARLFSGLTFDRFRSALAPLGPSMVAIGAIAGGRPVGLAIGPCEGGEAELLSVAVSPAERNRGIGLGLLQAWQGEAASRGAATMVARYNETIPGRPAFEALAAEASWSAPVEDGLIVLGRAGAMAEAAGAWRTIDLRLSSPNLYDYAPVELSGADASAVEAYLAQPAAAGMLGPVALAQTMAPAFSTLIRRQGVLVGWVLAAEVERSGAIELAIGGERAIRYLEAFLDPAYWHSGITIGAYHHCYARQAALLGPKSVAVYYTNPSKPRMVAITRRRFASIADRIETILAVRRGGVPLSPPRQIPSSLTMKGSIHEHRST
ncbi:GNAT family N-acetyltransferase [Pseudaminobacter soli (ex Li et al. 2025)]|uniref:GNAT family N-acetyltransferase n=1 Tax=Pseudaminobacter soli (ex Li et al. 2025) TaxID=1295366 RepID=UPI002475EC39|nr:GNAT family N-acetyltransferase [Mesorhizobium soli]